jgi:hypothetical protein
MIAVEPDMYVSMKMAAQIVTTRRWCGNNWRKAMDSRSMRGMQEKQEKDYNGCNNKVK